MIFLVIRFFGVVVAVGGPTPYTMEECIQSIEALVLPVELKATATCVATDTKPSLGVLTPEQQQAVDAWAAKQQ